MTHPGRLAIWFIVLAVISATISYISHALFRRARRDPENSEFFDVVPAATWRDHLARIIPTVLCAFAGVLLWVIGEEGWPALIAVFLVLTVITKQMRIAAIYWRLSVSDT
jgi:hypothetical protein